MDNSNRRIRLLCVGRDLRGGGAERVQLALLEKLNQHCDVNLVYLHDGGVLEPLAKHLSPRFLLSEGTSLKRNALSVLQSLRIMARSSDVVFAMQDGAPIYLASVAAHLERRPAVGWVHSTWTQMLGERLAMWHRWASALLYPWAQATICVSEGVAADLAEWSPRLRGKVLALPNAIDLDSIRNLSAEALPNWALPIYSKATVVAVGRFVRQKRFDILIEAFASAQARGLDANLLILGDGELRPQLESLVSELELEERVFLPGYQINPYPFFKRASVFASSSDYEGLSMVILEAMALSIPVIATDCPHGPRELLQGGRCGLLVPTGDVPALAEAIYAAISDRNTRGDTIENGLRRSSDFDAQRVAQKFADLFAGILRLYRSKWQRR